jgi:repressor LexA
MPLLHTAIIGSMMLLMQRQSVYHSQPTTAQKRILRFVHEKLIASGSAPSQEEIAEQFGYRSLNTVRQHLRLMERKGVVRLHHGKARGIQILRPEIASPPDSANRDVPLVGRIAAGQPIWAEENTEDRIDLPAWFGDSDRLFALRVHGESMTGAGILDGDIAVLEKCPAVEDGEIAAVRVGDEATLKRVFREAHRIILRAANDAFPEIVVDRGEAERLSIEGRFVGLLRLVGKTIQQK